MLGAFLYAIVGILSCYTALIVVNVYEWEWEHNPLCYVYPIGSLFLWPITMSFTLLVLAVIFMNKSSEAIAKRIKTRNK